MLVIRCKGSRPDHLWSLQIMMLVAITLVSLQYAAVSIR